MDIGPVSIRDVQDTYDPVVVGALFYFSVFLGRWSWRTGHMQFLPGWIGTRMIQIKVRVLCRLDKISALETRLPTGTRGKSPSQIGLSAEGKSVKSFLPHIHPIQPFVNLHTIHAGGDKTRFGEVNPSFLDNSDSFTPCLGLLIVKDDFCLAQPARRFPGQPQSISADGSLRV